MARRRATNQTPHTMTPRPQIETAVQLTGAAKAPVVVVVEDVLVVVVVVEAWCLLFVGRKGGVVDDARQLVDDAWVGEMDKTRRRRGVQASHFSTRTRVWWSTRFRYPARQYFGQSSQRHVTT